ncbi:MAG: UDP-N-acetylmuramoyl-L-alanine--D-glutamate ligase [Bacteroidota bacterium]
MHIIEKLAHKSCLILGFGREGKSTYRFLRSKFPDKEIVVADGNSNLEITEYQNDNRSKFILGVDYLSYINQFEIVIKTPGISLKDFEVSQPTEITSQTDIFLQLYSNQTIGITGTKGKSTTTTLIYHILSQHNSNVLLAGNMGIPLFDIVDKINSESIIVCEFSSHQLEYLTVAPHISILLNLFQEHLDHYKSYEHYQLAKLNIAIKQQSDDYFIYNYDDETIANLLNTNKIASNKIPFSTQNMLTNGYFLNSKSDLIKSIEQENDFCYSFEQKFPLLGNHNRKNMIAATIIAELFQISTSNIVASLKSFNPLPHRLEYVGTHQGIDFYNDSISTIPQATIEALNTLKNTETLILGGFDRGIAYESLIQYLIKNPVKNIIFTGNAGKRMLELWEMEISKPKINCYFEEDYRDILSIVFEVTKPGKICLLSPAASSYDKFKNFEHRGDFYKELIQIHTN